MPNHVHAVVMPFDDHQLGAIVQAWKSFTAKRANRFLDRTGPFWHKDYFDRFIRDEGHLERTIDYIENNPVKAGLASSITEWRWGSARLRVET
jgi:REP element-mobilizing transposase RayT